MNLNHSLNKYFAQKRKFSSNKTNCCH